MLNFQVVLIHLDSYNEYTLLDEGDCKKVFYREVDTSNCTKIKEIEEKVFLQVVKKEIIKECGAWTGSNSNNRMADRLIAKTVRNSFKNYESKKDLFEDSYFDF